jgi:CYTH domain-containing protein
VTEYAEIAGTRGGEVRPAEVSDFREGWQAYDVDELERVEEELPRPLPAWVGREVTGDPRYTNSNLARMTKRPAWLGR